MKFYLFIYNHSFTIAYFIIASLFIIPISFVAQDNVNILYMYFVVFPMLAIYTIFPIPVIIVLGLLLKHNAHVKYYNLYIKSTDKINC